MNTMKRRKNEPPRSVDVQQTTGEALERAKRLSQSGNDVQLCMCLVVKVKSDAVENNVAYKLGMSGP